MFSECKQYVGCNDEDEIDQNSTFAVLQKFFPKLVNFIFSSSTLPLPVSSSERLI